MHMLVHLLLGMLAPLLMALAAPMTLLLRTLSVSSARVLSRVLSSRPLRLLTHPVIASFLNLGGLWLLYTTDLYSLMHENILLHQLLRHGGYGYDCSCDTAFPDCRLLVERAIRIRPIIIFNKANIFHIKS